MACGDALGTTLEFTDRADVEPVENIVGGGPFDLEAGQWTDDTSMALCLAESLIECEGFDPVDQLERYVRWYREGTMSCTGECFDIGQTTRKALVKFEETGDPYPGPTGEYTAGNGSLMRLAPVPLAFHRDPETAIKKAAESSRTTHGAKECVDACRYFAGLIVGAVKGNDKDDLLSARFSPAEGKWEEGDLAPKIDGIASGSFKNKNRSEIESTGYVVHTLEAVLWAFYHTDTFREGALKVVNLGHDADTTGAVYGQLAGAYYGVDGIPDDWLEVLAQSQLIEGIAEDLPGFSPIHIRREQIMKCVSDVTQPYGEPQEVCAICEESFDEYDPEFGAGYVNLVCVHCDDEAVNKSGEEPFHEDRIEERDGEKVHVMSDGGDNPVYIDGEKCWRRYRYGGWITFRDDHDCDDLIEFYHKHFPPESPFGAVV